MFKCEAFVLQLKIEVVFKSNTLFKNKTNTVEEKKNKERTGFYYVL